MSDDRAVAEVLGYVLVISLVTIMIAVVLTMGISGLEHSQQSEHLQNMERGFDVLHHNIDEMVSGEAPSRATELRLLDGTMRYGDRTTFNITKNGEIVDNHSISVHPLLFESDSGDVIAYESGAVIREDGYGSIMHTEPPIFVYDNQIVVHIVRTRPAAASERVVDHEGTVLVRGEQIGVETSNIVVEQEDTSIHVNTPRTEAWESYLSTMPIGNVTITPGSDEVEWNIDQENVSIAVVHTHIRIEYKE